MRIAGVLVAASLFTVACTSCGDDDAAKAGGSSSGTSGSGGTSSGGASSGGGSSGGTSSGGTSSGGTSGAPLPPAPDDGLIPSTSIWRTTSEWYRAIDGAPTAEHSGEMIGAVKTWGQTDIFQIDFSFNVLDATGGTPTTFPPDDEGDSVPVPIPAKGYVEGDYDYASCPSGEDCHVLIVDRTANRLYELYHVKKNGAKWNGYLALWKLDKAYPRSNRGQGCTSADAAGMAITPGLIGYAETKKGEIHHALRFIVRNDYIRGVVDDKNVPNVVYPASHGSMAGASATGVPYGARLRLKKSVLDTDPRIKSPGAHAVVKALRTYGMILSDGGNLPLVAESAKVAHDTDPTASWDDLLAPRDLGFLRPSDFEVVAIPKADPSQPNAGWYQTKAEYNGQLRKPLGCDVIVQP